MDQNKTDSTSSATSSAYKRFYVSRRETGYYLLVALLLVVAGLVYHHAEMARWFGFCLAAYSAIANDSIQTIGTFIASNGHRKWWKLWLFIGTLFLITVSISWLVWDGDVTYQRLSTKGFDQAPTSFQFLQIAAPVFLLVITRLRMPVSTTFLLLSSFTTDPMAILEVFKKSVSGYIIAFLVSFVFWHFLNGFIRRLVKGPAHPGWDVAQWITSGLLWCIWIMQDAANVAVYLPRKLDFMEFLAFAGFIFFGLSVIFYLRGDRIQEVINEKSDVHDVRSATLIDLVYTLILVVFQYVSTIPMSTTWVFIGLLGGRELAISSYSGDQKQLLPSLRLIRKDLLYALIGLLFSVALALAVNPVIQQHLQLFFFSHS